MWRPRRVALPFGLVTRRHLEQGRERVGPVVDRRMRVADRDVALRHGPQREVGWGARLQLVPRHRRRDACIGLRPHRVRRRHGAVLRVLVVVDEDALSLLLPPCARREARRAALDVAGQRQRRTPDLVEGPATRDPHEDVDAARARRLRPAGQAEIRERLADDGGDLPDLRPLDARNRIEVDAQLVGMVEVLCADRMRMQLEAREVRHPRELGRMPRDHLVGAATRREADRRDLELGGPLGRRPLLEEEGAADTVGIADQHAGTTAGAAERPVGDRHVVLHEIELRDLRVGDQQARRVRDDDGAIRHREFEVVVVGHGVTPSATRPGTRRR